MSKIAKREKEDYLLKIIIIGDSGVGKTNVLVRFCENDFKQSYVATIGVDFKIKSISVNDTKLKFQIWDTAGQERYKTIAQTYYKGASGIILTYSITDEKSLANIENWVLQIQQHSSPEVKKILIGNKCDNEQERKVSTSEGQRIADKYNMSFYEVSAKSGKNIYEAFEALGKEILEHFVANDPRKFQNSKLSVDNKQQSKQKNCAC